MKVNNNSVSLHKCLNIATWNVRSAKCIGKINIICKEMERYNHCQDLSDVKWNGKGSFKTEEGKTIIYSGKEKDEGYNYGVGILLDKEMAKSIIGYNPVNDRILTLRIKAKPYNATIIQIYAPTSDAEEEEIIKFYDILQDTIDKIPRRDLIILMGDFNAKVGKSVYNTSGKFGLGEQNVQGQRFVEFCTINDLVIANTLFEHHPRRLYTWTSPDNKTKKQIDYITISQRWRSSVKNARTYPGADCNTDHQLLRMTFKGELPLMI